MKIRVKEKQYDLLVEYLEEARKAPSPTVLSSFFNENKNAKFFSIIQKIKGGSESEYDFKLSTVNGHRIVTDINKGTKTKNCSIDINFDTMIYGNKFSINFGKCGALNLNNVVGLNVFNDVEDLKNRTPTDNFKFDNNFDKNSSEIISDYYEELKKVDANEDIHFDSKYTYDGTVLQKFGNILRVELIQKGKKGRSIILNIDLFKNPFYEENGDIYFKSKSSKGENEQSDFVIQVKDFFVDVKGRKPQQDEPEKKQDEPEKKQDGPEVEDPEELRREAKRAMEIILNDPDLKKAFYSQPSLWNLFVAELKGKEAVGKGIVPTLRIINGYETKSLKARLSAEFIEGKKIGFKPFETVEVPYIRNDKDLAYTFDKLSNLEYHPIILPRKLGESYKVKGKLEDYLGYEIELLEKVKEEQDVFECKITMIVLKESTTNRYPYDGKFFIKISRNETTSPGYNPNQTNN